MPKTKAPPRQQNRLRELRERGIVLSQPQVAKLLGIDHTTVSSHENGRRKLTKDQIEAYAKLYGVSTLEIYVEVTENGPKH